MESGCIILEREFAVMNRKFHLLLIYNFESQNLSLLSKNLPWWIIDVLVILPIKESDLFPNANKRKVISVLNDCAMQVIKNPLSKEHFY